MTKENVPELNVEQEEIYLYFNRNNKGVVVPHSICDNPEEYYAKMKRLSFSMIGKGVLLFKQNGSWEVLFERTETGLSTSQPTRFK